MCKSILTFSLCLIDDYIVNYINVQRGDPLYRFDTFYNVDQKLKKHVSVLLRNNIDTKRFLTVKSLDII